MSERRSSRPPEDASRAYTMFDADASKPQAALT